MHPSGWGSEVQGNELEATKSSVHSSRLLVLRMGRMRLADFLSAGPPASAMTFRDVVSRPSRPSVSPASAKGYSYVPGIHGMGSSRAACQVARSMSFLCSRYAPTETMPPPCTGIAMNIRQALLSCVLDAAGSY